MIDRVRFLLRSLLEKLGYRDGIPVNGRYTTMEWDISLTVPPNGMNHNPSARKTLLKTEYQDGKPILQETKKWGFDEADKWRLLYRSETNPWISTEYEVCADGSEKIIARTTFDELPSVMNSIIERAKPAPGEKWRYFGGNEYWIIAIATHCETGEPLVIYAPDKETEFPLIAFHTETDKVFSVGECRREMIAIPVIGCFESLDAWASSLDNFLGVVSHPYGEESSNCYRFEKCEP